MNSEEYPQELSLLSFSYLSELKDAIRVLGVCKAWRLLGADQTLWRHRNLPLSLALLFARHGIATSYGLDIHFAQVPRLFARDSHRTEAWHQVSFLRDAVSDRAIGDALRKAVVRLHVYNEAGMEAELDLLWNNVIAVFAGGAITEVHSNMPLSQFKWLPGLRRAQLWCIDCSPTDIANTWRSLTRLGGAVTLEPPYDLEPDCNELRSVVHPSLQMLNIGPIPDGTTASFTRAFKGLPSLRVLDENRSVDLLRAVASHANHLTSFEVYMLSEFQAPAGPPQWSTYSYPELKDLRLDVTLPYDSEVPDPADYAASLNHLRACLSNMLHAAPKLRDLRLSLHHPDGERVHQPLLAAAFLDQCRRHPALASVKFEVEYGSLSPANNPTESYIERGLATGLCSLAAKGLLCSSEWVDVLHDRFARVIVTNEGEDEPTITLYYLPLAWLESRDGWEVWLGATAEQISVAYECRPATATVIWRRTTA